MVLVMLTEPDPEEALISVMKRCAYILVPISILFIKYFPEWGRGYDGWSGTVAYTGITGGKNLLGADCFIFGFFFVWYFLKVWRQPKTKGRHEELLLSFGFIYMIAWLLISADSKTSLTALILGLVVLLFAGWPGVNKRYVGFYLVLAAGVLLLAEFTFGIYGMVLKLLGRNPTLTERTFLWHDLLQIDINPLLGAGFENFWLGERLERIWILQPWRPNQAHNGYLDTYLNIGLIGLFLLIALLFATYGKARRELLRNFEFGRFRLGFLLAAIAYNWTEAGFKTLHLVFFAFYIITIDYPQRRRSTVPAPAETRDSLQGAVVSGRTYVMGVTPS